jgi:hypothetical protein
MEIRIFGMTVRLEILIIALIVGMIMGGHLLCACAKVPLSEAFGLGGLEGMTEGLPKGETNGEPANKPVVQTDSGHEATGETANENQPQATVVPTGSKPAANNKISAETIKEMSTMLPNVLNGFQSIMSGAKPPTGETDAFTDYSTYKGGDNNSDVASSWINKADAYSKNLGYQQTAQKANMYTGTQVPLPDGQLFFFQNNQFKPECCPSPYSASTGCACMSSEQIAYLNSRGGNRSGDSEF